eukprot:1136551-Pelagomonas_calceolata.AAC.1
MEHLFFEASAWQDLLPSFTAPSGLTTLTRLIRPIQTRPWLAQTGTDLCSLLAEIICQVQRGRMTRQLTLCGRDHHS